MTWVRIDDQLHGHPKIRKAWRGAPRALGLHLLALSYAGAYLTDGHVPEEFVEEKLPGSSERTKTVQTLVDAELWLPPETGEWTIHDYLDRNPSRAEVLARRATDSARKRNGSRAES